jgi:hypothetical protein
LIGFEFELFELTVKVRVTVRVEMEYVVLKGVKLAVLNVVVVRD